MDTTWEGILSEQELAKPRLLENDMRGEEERNIASCEVLPTFLRVKTFKRQ